MDEVSLPIDIKPIGYVENKVKQKPPQEFEWEGVSSNIIIKPELEEGLDGLEEYSHIIVIWWMHKSLEEGKMALKVHPRRRKGMPPVGVFASRSPYRPNSIGKAVLKLVKRSGNVLEIKGLDAINDTPVLDIKPFIPGYDSKDDASIPEWMQKQAD